MSEHINPKTETWPKTETYPDSGLSTLLGIIAVISFIAAFILWVGGEEPILVIGIFVGGFQLFITAYVLKALKNMEFYLKVIYEK